MDKKGQSLELVLILIITVALIVFIVYKNPGFTPGIGSNQSDNTVCTADAKLCPDGTYVGRSGPNCEFVCPSNNSRILPNRALAPGDVLTNNLTIICVSGYSSTVRDVPQSLREEVFARDGVPYPQPTGTTELDHIIPLCLGGSNAEDNLYVEFAEPRPGFKEKDKLENYLCDHVCSGEINIDYAQQRIASDWYSYYQEIYG